MAKRGRKTKLNNDVQQQICDLIAMGVTDRDAYDAANISHDTFYRWLNEFPEFSDAVTRARARAKIDAIATLRSAFKFQREVRETTTTVTETRLTKTGQPYDYTKSETVRTIVLHPPDWKAGAEYLKRKHRDEWSERAEISVEDWHSQAIADIRAGYIQFEALAEAFDHDIATELFRAAGVPIQTE